MRWITFRSWRMLPGHACAHSASSVRGSSDGRSRPRLAASERANATASAGISSRALAQGRHAERDDVEPPEEILAETPVLAPRPRGPCWWRDDAAVDTQRLRAADPLELAGLEEVEEPRLDLGRDLADLVQERGAAVRGLEAARLPLGGAGERALLVPNSAESTSCDGSATQFT
jgi:hypothetical protein